MYCDVSGRPVTHAKHQEPAMLGMQPSAGWFPMLTFHLLLARAHFYGLHELYRKLISDITDEAYNCSVYIQGI